MAWQIIDTVPCAEIGYRAIIDEDGFTVCDPSPMGADRARLIAAAPVMIEALLRAREALRVVRTDPAHPIKGQILAADTNETLADVIDQAIRIALGEQS